MGVIFDQHSHPAYCAEAWCCADGYRRITRYFARHGIPKTPDELALHNCVDFSYARAVKSWPLSEKGVQKTIPPSGNVQVSDGDALRTLAISGVGLVRLASFIISDDIAANRLVPVLEEFNPGDIDELHAVYLGQAGFCRCASVSSSIFWPSRSNSPTTSV